MAATQNFKQLQAEYIRRFRNNPNDTFRDETFSIDRMSTLFDERKPPADNEDAKWREHVTYMVQKTYYRWMRAPEIAQQHRLRPELVVKEPTQLDINQGNVGNCWFLAGAAHLADRDDLFNQIVPKDQDFGKNYGGIFHFYLWHYGEWREVIVDDYILCVGNIEHGWMPAFVKNYKEKNEFWAPLLEKAYAKLNGSYEDISGGFTRWSMVDTTGGIGYRISFGRNHISNNSLMNLIESLQENDTIFGCSGVPKIDGAKTNRGLHWYHAYTFLGTVRVQDTQGTYHQLMRIINPHGHEGDEWTGPWNDKDNTNWNKLKTEDRERLRSTKLEGEFYMSFHDFTTYFQAMDACLVPQVNPNARPRRLTQVKPSWNIYTSSLQAWIPGKSLGGQPDDSTFWYNPQLRFYVEPLPGAQPDQTRKVFVSVTRVTPGETNPDWTRGQLLNMELYKLFDNKRDLLDWDNYRSRVREVPIEDKHTVYSGWRDLTLPYRLSPGFYCAVPWLNTDYSRSSNYKEEKFILRVAFGGQN